jgi:hypothetical protein
MCEVGPEMFGEIEITVPVVLSGLSWDEPIHIEHEVTP